MISRLRSIFSRGDSAPIDPQFTGVDLEDDFGSAEDEILSLNTTGFEYDMNEVNQIREWQLKHLGECSLPRVQTAIGDRWTYSFTPTSIGAFVSVSCPCGDKCTVDSNF